MRQHYFEFEAVMLYTNIPILPNLYCNLCLVYITPRWNKSYLENHLYLSQLSQLTLQVYFYIVKIRILLGRLEYLRARQHVPESETKWDRTNAKETELRRQTKEKSCLRPKPCAKCARQFLPSHKRVKRVLILMKHLIKNFMLFCASN